MFAGIISQFPQKGGGGAGVTGSITKGCETTLGQATASIALLSGKCYLFQNSLDSCKCLQDAVSIILTSY